MNPILMAIQIAGLAAALAFVVACFYYVVRSDLRENPAKAKMPMPWHGIEAIRDYIATVKFDPEAESEDDEDESVDQTDPGAEWDRARDLQIARELGVA
ncbi:hypothetical protein ACFWPK_33170 [Nocardia sp. NPDC058519]|uniref:hypothetical protein n=1 Tax=Nocardia sp. NPDC058519 TaxID=3346535 RepID=UPI00364ACFA8